MRVNLAGHIGHNLVCGKEGILPLCERILDTLPSLVNSTISRSLELPASEGGLECCRGGIIVEGRGELKFSRDTSEVMETEDVPSSQLEWTHYMPIQDHS